MSLMFRSSPGKMRFCGLGGSHTSLKSTVLSFIPPIKIHLDVSQSTKFPPWKVLEMEVMSILGLQKIVLLIANRDIRKAQFELAFAHIKHGNANIWRSAPPPT